MLHISTNTGIIIQVHSRTTSFPLLLAHSTYLSSYVICNFIILSIRLRLSSLYRWFLVIVVHATLDGYVLVRPVTSTRLSVNTILV
jgi:hypothetical protein